MFADRKRNSMILLENGMLPRPGLEANFQSPQSILMTVVLVCCPGLHCQSITKGHHDYVKNGFIKVYKSSLMSSLFISGDMCSLLDALSLLLTDIKLEPANLHSL